MRLAVLFTVRLMLLLRRRDGTHVERWTQDGHGTTHAGRTQPSGSGGTRTGSRHEGVTLSHVEST